MSRIIVKNLPNQINAKKLAEVFSAQGAVTDIQLKHTAAGKFRGFAFVGFQSDEHAETARKALDKSFINTNQISVEVCKALDDPNKPRAWSKHSIDRKIIPKKEAIPQPKKLKKIKDAKVAKLLESHKGDVLFEEFMEAHLPENKDLWKKDAKEADDEVNEDFKEADKVISDLEYLKSKKKKVKLSDEPEVNDASQETFDPTTIQLDRLSVKVSNLPCTVKKADIKEFLKPAKPASVRIPVKMKGIAYCDFATASELKKALLKNRSFMGTRRVIVKTLEKEKKQAMAQVAVKRRKEEERLQQGETVAESGRLFLRNLAFTVIEDDLRSLFEKFGPVTEVNVPVDPMSRKSKGFGFVTFLIPEHACRALNEMDGTVLHGRMLHVLPGLAKVEETEDDDAGLNYKQKKLKKQKQQANNKINWNTFFINDNCLAEAMADTFNTTKETVLSDGKGGGGAAVRLALGETDMVHKTKDFLTQNGVSLEAFENMGDAPRSETVILIKNLPYKTQVSEILDKFAGFGELSNVLLSPYGGTSIVEFIEPSEARKAFRRLAYSKFKHIPLYLEWAPKTIFDARNIKPEPVTEPVKTEKIEEEKTVDENHVPMEGATIYVKGINFSTNSARLKEHFEQCGQVVSAIVAEKRDPRNPGQKLSMGYGFVEFADTESADKALKTLQFSSLESHTIELKRSNRTTNESTTARARAAAKGKPSTKMVVRNVPFQATQHELRDLFKVFGEIKALRLPKKMVGTGTHRGFCFLEYQTIHDAKRAFAALSESTHLYGRRLVLEWAEVDDDVETLRQKTAKQFSAPSRGEKRKNISLEDLPEEDE